jgi:hypothetical protein
VAGIRGEEEGGRRKNTASTMLFARIHQSAQEDQPQEVSKGKTKQIPATSELGRRACLCCCDVLPWAVTNHIISVGGRQKLTRLTRRLKSYVIIV